MRAPKLHVWQTCFLALTLLTAAACGGGAVAESTSAVPTPDLNIPIEDLLVYVPAGQFIMGSDEELDSLARPDEFPQHDVVVDGFFIYRNEVTNGLYAQCVAAGQCTQPEVVEDENDPEADTPSQHYGEEEYKDHPVVGVNWDQASAFCAWVDARLPTEAEWEKTSRGEYGGLYPWGDDAPTCNLANGDCFLDTITDKIGQYPDGESTYEAKDLAGNVWEWTSDWYQPDYYAVAALNNPLGPEKGELKVVRGGGYVSGPVDLRSAARMALDPDEAFNDVGFRCIPIGLPSPGQAAFCQPSYIPFCTNPNNPGEECTPPPTGQTTPTGPDFEWLGFTCPRDGFITFSIDAGGPAADDYEVTINGITYNCVDSTVNPGRLICTGTAQPQNTFVTISVCPSDGANSGSQLVALTPTPSAGGGQPDALVAFNLPQPEQAKLISFHQQQPVAAAGLQAFNPAANNPAGLQAFQAASAYCPEGMIYNPDTQQCESNPNGACPDGWSYEPTTGQCIPTGDDNCPEGTTYSIDQQACVPDDGSSCPAPYVYDEATGLCQPPANDDGGGLCPAGYFYDRNILCCSPVQGGNNGCAEGTYMDAATGACQPLDENGCPDGTTYNRYEGACLPDNGQDGSNGTDGQPTTPIQRTVGGCQPDQYFDPATQQCIDLGDGQCGPGFYYDERMGSCRPTDGPGSGCAIGYAFSERLNCCVPTPGNDGSSCPGDQQTGRTLQGLTNLAAPSLTGFNYGTGLCDPDGDGCPSGYFLNPQTQACEPLTGRSLNPPTDNGNCEEGYYYDEAYGACVPDGFEPVVDGCGEGQYFDYSLGYCVQTTSCGCPLGYDFNFDTQTCESEGQVTSSGCWVTTQSVPSCPFQPEPTPVCDRGTTYVPSTGKCERDDPGGGGIVSCGSYNNKAACDAAGCNWAVFGAGAICY